MSYGTKYTASFESTVEETYTVYILEKDYVGDITALELSGVPVRHSWATDEAQPAVKGSSLTLSILNTGDLPITSFYSNNDDQFKIWFYHNSNKLFEGYLVQDDCSELMVDYVHEIILSFNDNLGLLKDIPLDQNVVDFGGYPCTAYFDFVSVIPDNFIYLYNTDFIPVVSTPFTIFGHIEAAANDVWTPTAVTNLGGGNWKVQVVDGAFTDMQAWPCSIVGSASINLYNRNTLLNIIKVCLSATGLDLDTHIYANIFETSNDTDRSFLEQTYIDAQTFLNDNSFKNCYEVLEIILGRFGLTLFQANGVWNIVRWYEFRLYTSPYPVPYFIYNSAMEYTGAGTMDNLLVTGFTENIYPENGLTRSIVRPWSFEHETFNYVQPKYLLKNFDLQDLGTFITSYASGLYTYSEYEFPNWKVNTAVSGSPALELFMRVVTLTSTGLETDRYAVVLGNTTAVALPALAMPFEVTTGDLLSYELTFKTSVSNTSPSDIYIGLMLKDGTITQYASNSDPLRLWSSFEAWYYALPPGSNTNEYQNVVIQPAAIPYNGLIYCCLPQADTDFDGETHIKDIRITYTPSINESIKINGQVHKSQSDELNVKNNQSVDLLLDDSPRNAIAGTLFKPTFTSLIQDKTSSWYRIQVAGPEALRIGEIISTESLVIKLIPRTKLEGTFYGLSGVSMLAILTNTALPTLNFLFGSLEIDYRNNSFSCTQYEMYIDDEAIVPRPAVSYEFKYLYSKT